MKHKEYIPFGDTSVSTLLEKMHIQVCEKEAQIKELLDMLQGHINSLDDIVIVSPIIKDFLVASLKNSEINIKLLDLIQKMSKSDIEREDGIELAGREGGVNKPNYGKLSKQEYDELMEKKKKFKKGKAG